MEKDLYEILGVKKAATEAELRKAFHQLAKKFHPDMNPGDKGSEQRFKEVNLAYEVLKDPKKRAQYDAMRAAGANPFSRPGAGAQGPGGGQWRQQGPNQGAPFGEGFGDFGLGDLFEEIFGGGAGAAGARRGQGRPQAKWAEDGAGFRRKGTDQETLLTISFMEAARGGERFIELTDGRKLTVTIPEGVDSGSKIKLKGQGEAGMGGAPAGDLILSLTVMPHGHFTREEGDILLKVPVSFAEAVLGTEIEVPTLDGKAVVKLPMGVSSGQRLKLAGKGVRTAKTGTRGDQYVEVYIKLPKPPDARYQEAARLLQADPYNPRSDLW